MPPFKSTEEKRQYILDHKPVFDALGIKLTEDYVDALVYDHYNDKKYAANESYPRARDKQEKESKTFFTQSNAFNNKTIARLPGLLYDASGTPQARKWNEHLKAIVEDPSRVKEFANICSKIILDFDDSVLTEGPEAIDEYVMKHHSEADFIYGAVDLINNLHNIYDLDNPAEAAIANAVRDKYLHIQTILAYGARSIFAGTKLSLILPELDQIQAVTAHDGITRYLKKCNSAVENAEKALKNEPDNPELLKQYEEAKANADEATFERSQLQTMMAYHLQIDEYNKTHKKIYTELEQNSLIGSEGIYNRAYKIQNGQKVYLTKEAVVKAYASEEDKKGIEFETISKEEREAIDKMLQTTWKKGDAPLWSSVDEKRQMANVVKSALARVGYNMTDKQVDDVVNQKTDDIKVLRLKDLRSTLEEADMGYFLAESTGITDDARTVGSLHINGDTKEIKEWNEKISLLAQTPEGVEQIVKLAVNRLISIDLKDLTQSDENARTQFLLDHPVERHILWRASNVMNAYLSTLKGNDKRNDPAYRVLEDRKLLFEAFGSDFNTLTARASRIAPLIPENISREQYMLIQSDVIEMVGSSKDPYIVANKQEILNDIGSFAKYKLFVDENAERKGIELFYSKGKITDKTLSRRPYTEVEVVDKDGNKTIERKYYSLEAAAIIVNEKPEKLDEFKFDEMDTKMHEVVDKFRKDAPIDPVLNATPEEIKRLKEIKETRILKENNQLALGKFAKAKKALAPENAGLLEVVAIADDAGSGLKFTSAFRKAFEYVASHRDYSGKSLEQDKLELALATMAQFDGECTKKLVERINIERELCHAISQPKIDLNDILERAGVMPGERPAKEIFNYRDPFDKRMQNVKEIYEHLRDNKDPWYHKNSEKFKDMMQSMKMVLEYASTTRKPDAKVIESMLATVKETSTAYVRYSDARLGLGQDRRSAALATIIALNPEEGRLLLNEVKETNWVEGFAKKMGMASEHIERKDVLNHINLSMPLNKEKILAKMSEDLERTKAEAGDLENADAAAQYMVKERIYNSLKNNTVDGKAIIGYMTSSKSLVREQSEHILNDDVYRTVINSIKLDNHSSLDKTISEIESKYIQAKADEVKNHQAVEQRKAEHERAERQMQENNKSADLNESIGSMGVK